MLKDFGESPAHQGNSTKSWVLANECWQDQSCTSSLDRIVCVVEEYFHAPIAKQQTPSATYSLPHQRQWHQPHASSGYHRDWPPPTHLPPLFPGQQLLPDNQWEQGEAI